MISLSYLFWMFHFISISASRACTSPGNGHLCQVSPKQRLLHLLTLKKAKKNDITQVKEGPSKKNMVEQCLNMYGLFQKRLNINYLYRLWVQEYRYKALTRHINLFLLSWQRTPVHLQMNSTEKRTSCPSPCEQGECQKLIDQRLHCITWSSSCCCCGCSVGLISYSWLVVYPPL